MKAQKNELRLWHLTNKGKKATEKSRKKAQQNKKAKGNDGTIKAQIASALKEQIFKAEKEVKAQEDAEAQIESLVGRALEKWGVNWKNPIATTKVIGATQASLRSTSSNLLSVLTKAAKNSGS